MNRHIMLDIETLDTRPTAVVMQIGALVFDDNLEAIKHFDRRVDVDEQLETLNRTVSTSTLSWWFTQARDGKPPPFSVGTGLDVKTVLAELGELCANAQTVWANSPSFDCVIVSSLAAAARVNDPLPPFYRHRDFRTWKAVVCADLYRSGQEFVTPAAAHDGLADCEQQLRTMRTYRHIVNPL